MLAAGMKVGRLHGTPRNMTLDHATDLVNVALAVGEANKGRMVAAALAIFLLEEFA
jgi:hypothetical protein